MKEIAAVTVLAFALVFLVNPSYGRDKVKPKDPCENKGSNADMRNCYAREQARVNTEVDSLALKIAAGFEREAKEPVNAPVVSGLLRNAASSITQSQNSWKVFRDQHCTAVEFSWTNGSGAGTAYEACLFDLGQQRLRQLRSAFARDNSK